MGESELFIDSLTLGTFAWTWPAQNEDNCGFFASFHQQILALNNNQNKLEVLF